MKRNLRSAPAAPTTFPPVARPAFPAAFLAAAGMLALWSVPEALTAEANPRLPGSASAAQTDHPDATRATHPGTSVPLFDGRSFRGWEGDTQNSFRLEDGAIVAGNLKQPVPRNEFLCTTRQYANFVLRLECKLVGPGNAGIQIRSQRVPNHHEVSGYQADMSAGADGGYWGCLYDESRRNKMLARPEREVIRKALRPDDWNRYEIRCEGPRIRLSINGVPTVDYTEPDAKIPATGVIGLQIHGGPPSEAWYRNLTIKVLP